MTSDTCGLKPPEDPYGLAYQFTCNLGVKVVNTATSIWKTAWSR